jgi:hypothetical protein
MLHYTEIETIARDEDSSLLDPFVSFKDDEMLWT